MSLLKKKTRAWNELSIPQLIFVHTEINYIIGEAARIVMMSCLLTLNIYMAACMVNMHALSKQMSHVLYTYHLTAVLLQL